MKLARGLGLCVTAVMGFQVNAEQCPWTEIKKYRAMDSSGVIPKCFREAGVNLFVNAPTTEQQNSKVCATPACRQFFSAVRRADPSDCDLALASSLRINFLQLVNKWQPHCDSLGSTPTRAAPIPTTTSASPSGSNGSGSDSPTEAPGGSTGSTSDPPAPTASPEAPGGSSGSGSDDSHPPTTPTNTLHGVPCPLNEIQKYIHFPLGGDIIQKCIQLAKVNPLLEPPMTEQQLVQVCATTPCRQFFLAVRAVDPNDCVLITRSIRLNFKRWVNQLKPFCDVPGSPSALPEAPGGSTGSSSSDPPTEAPSRSNGTGSDPSGVGSYSNPYTGGPLRPPTDPRHTLHPPTVAPVPTTEVPPTPRPRTASPITASPVVHVPVATATQTPAAGPRGSIISVASRWPNLPTTKPPPTNPPPSSTNAPGILPSTAAPTPMLPTTRPPRPSASANNPFDTRVIVQMEDLTSPSSPRSTNGGPTFNPPTAEPSRPWATQTQASGTQTPSTSTNAASMLRASSATQVPIGSASQPRAPDQNQTLDQKPLAPPSSTGYQPRSSSQAPGQSQQTPGTPSGQKPPAQTEPSQRQPKKSTQSSAPILVAPPVQKSQC